MIRTTLRAAVAALALALLLAPTLLAADASDLPFNLEQVKAYWKKGLVMKQKMHNVAGDVFFEREVTAANEEGYTLETRTLDAAGHVLGKNSSPWSWQSHWNGLVPSKTATKSTETLDTPMGKIECVKFDSTFGSKDDAVETRRWFAASIPGVEIKVESGTKRGMMSVEVVGVTPAK